MALPTRIAAVPRYIATGSNEALVDAPPGHRFLMYFRNWQGDGDGAFEPYKDVRVERELPPEHRRQQEQQRKKEVSDVLQGLCTTSDAGTRLASAVRNRQARMAAIYGDAGYSQQAISTAPFATGLGNEHPIENGFAFLTPYGLPYLAGSGIKGVLRRAAEELALDNELQAETDWTWLDTWWLFGFEGAAGSLWIPDSDYGRAFSRDIATLSGRSDLYGLMKILLSRDKKNARLLDRAQDRRADFLHLLCADARFRQSLHFRGALDFWDCFPQPANDRLVVEIMTPHYGAYYRGDETPHDAGQPIPVSFLAVPAGSEFDFRVVCHEYRLPETLRRRWKILLAAAFAHAFSWLGFGAKTSVGYGAMAERGSPRAAPMAASAERIETPPADTPWPSARLKFNPASGTLTAVGPSNAEAYARAPRGAVLLASLPPAVQQKVKNSQYVVVNAMVRGQELVEVKALHGPP